MAVVTTYFKGTMRVTSRLNITVTHFVTSEDDVTFLGFFVQISTTSIMLGQGGTVNDRQQNQTFFDKGSTEICDGLLCGRKDYFIQRHAHRAYRFQKRTETDH